MKLRKTGVSLSEFIKGVVKSLTDGQQAIPHARDQILRHHMDEGDDGIFRPKIHRVEVTPGQIINMATYSFGQVNTIGIKRAKIQCSANIVEMGEYKHEGKCSVGDTVATFVVNPSSTGRESFNMVIEFEQRDPSETEMHLIEALDRVAVVSSESETG